MTVLATVSALDIECCLGGPLAVALLLAPFNFRAFLCATSKTSAICRPVAFLAAIIAHVSSFGTFAVLALREDVNIHRDKLGVLSTPSSTGFLGAHLLLVYPDRCFRLRDHAGQFIRGRTSLVAEAAT